MKKLFFTLFLLITISIESFSNDFNWEKLSCYPYPKPVVSFGEYRCCELKDNLILNVFRRSYSDTIETWLYDYNTNRYIFLKNAHTPNITYSISNLNEGTALLFGGTRIYDGKGNYINSQETWKFTISDSNWHRILTSHSPYTVDTVETCKLATGKVLLYEVITRLDSGLIDSNKWSYGLSSDFRTWIYNDSISDWILIETKHKPWVDCWYSLTQVDDGEALIIQSKSWETNKDSVFIFDFKKKDWACIDTKNIPLTNLANGRAMIDTGRVLFYGGRSYFWNGIPNDTLYFFDKNTLLWSRQITKDTTPRVTECRIARLGNNKIFLPDGEFSYILRNDFTEITEKSKIDQFIFLSTGSVITIKSMLNAFDNIRLEVYDMLGNLIFQNSNLYLDYSYVIPYNFHVGVYFIKLQTDKEAHFGKVFINE